MSAAGCPRRDGAPRTAGCLGAPSPPGVGGRAAELCLGRSDLFSGAPLAGCSPCLCSVRSTGLDAVRGGKVLVFRNVFAVFVGRKRGGVQTAPRVSTTPSRRCVISPAPPVRTSPPSPSPCTERGRQRMSQRSCYTWGEVGRQRLRALLLQRAGATRGAQEGRLAS